MSKFKVKFVGLQFENFNFELSLIRMGHTGLYMNNHEYIKTTSGECKSCCTLALASSIISFMVNRKRELLFFKYILS